MMYISVVSWFCGDVAARSTLVGQASCLAVCALALIYESSVRDRDDGDCRHKKERFQLFLVPFVDPLRVGRQARPDQSGWSRIKDRIG